MMKFIIHYNGRYEDALKISGETLEEVRTKAFEECAKRGWEHDYCWSELVEE